MKLEDIPKKPIFDVPEGYFDQLPGKIQARISSNRPTETSLVFKYRLQYVVPVLFILLVAAIWFTRPQPANDVDSLLASVNTEDLVAYLNDSEITTEDVIEEVDFSANDIEDIESEVYQLQIDDDSFDGILNDMDVDSI